MATIFTPFLADNSKESTACALGENFHVLGLDFNRTKAVERHVRGYVKPLADFGYCRGVLGVPPNEHSFGIGRNHFGKLSGLTSR